MKSDEELGCVYLSHIVSLNACRHDNRNAVMLKVLRENRELRAENARLRCKIEAVKPLVSLTVTLLLFINPPHSESSAPVRINRIFKVI